MAMRYQKQDCRFSLTWHGNNVVRRLEKKVFIKSLMKHFKNLFMIHNFSIFYCFSFILFKSSLFTKSIVYSFVSLP